MEPRYNTLEKLIATVKYSLSNQRGIFSTLFMTVNVCLLLAYFATLPTEFTAGKYISLGSLVVFDFVALIVFCYITLKKPGNFNGPTDFNGQNAVSDESIRQHAEAQEIFNKQENPAKGTGGYKRIEVAIRVVATLFIICVSTLFVVATFKDSRPSYDETELILSLSLLNYIVGMAYSEYLVRQLDRKNKKRNRNRILYLQNLNSTCVLNSAIDRNLKRTDLKPLIKSDFKGDFLIPNRKTLRDEFRIRSENFDEKDKHHFSKKEIQNINTESRIVFIDCKDLFSNVSPN